MFHLRDAVRRKQQKWEIVVIPHIILLGGEKWDSMESLELERGKQTCYISTDFL